MEQIPIITESVQYGVIGICVMMIIANVIIVKCFIGAILKLYEKIDALNSNIADLNTRIEMLCMRTKIRKSKPQQSGIINHA